VQGVVTGGRADAVALGAAAAVGVAVVVVVALGGATAVAAGAEVAFAVVPVDAVVLGVAVDFPDRIAATVTTPTSAQPPAIAGSNHFGRGSRVKTAVTCFSTRCAAIRAAPKAPSGSSLTSTSPVSAGGDDERRLPSMRGGGVERGSAGIPRSARCAASAGGREELPGGGAELREGAATTGFAIVAAVEVGVSITAEGPGAALPAGAGVPAFAAVGAAARFSVPVTVGLTVGVTLGIAMGGAGCRRAHGRCFASGRGSVASGETPWGIG
jgi:hypothetical protein